MSKEDMRDRFATPRGTQYPDERPTVPAPDSVEEGWLLDVQRGRMSIGDAVAAAERLRDMKAASLMRLRGAS